MSCLWKAFGFSLGHGKWCAVSWPLGIALVGSGCQNKHHRLGLLGNRNLFLTGLGIRKSEIKVPVDSVPGEDLPESHRVLIMQTKARLCLLLFL